jgi:hypothetical protein
MAAIDPVKPFVAMNHCARRLRVERFSRITFEIAPASQSPLHRSRRDLVC